MIQSIVSETPKITVYNGDCMDFMKDLPDKAFDLAIVDPIYGDVTQGGYTFGKGGENKAKRIDYNLKLWEQPKTPKSYFDELFRISRNQIIWGGNYFMEVISKDSQCWIIWDKKHQDGVNFADAELAYTSFRTATRIFRYLWNGMIQERMGDQKEIRIHPTQKPVQLYRWLLKNYAKSGDTILDTHLGSASSAIAAYQEGFDFTGIELDVDYYNASIERFKRETAQLSMFR